MTATLPTSFAAPVSRIQTILLTAARGAALIGLAVVIGIVLLQVVDNPTGGTDGDTSGTSTATDDTSRNGGNGGAIDPSQVSVLVLNASGVQGAAQTQTDALIAAGYSTLTPGDAPMPQDGITVACNTGFEDAIQPLIDTIGQGATADAFPAEPPVPEAADANCIVILGTVT